MDGRPPAGRRHRGRPDGGRTSGGSLRYGAIVVRSGQAPGAPGPAERDRTLVPAAGLRYAVELAGSRVVQAAGPIGRSEGLGSRAIAAIVRDASDGAAPPAPPAKALIGETRHLLLDTDGIARLNALLESGGAELVEVPDVVRVRVGLMGDSVEFETGTIDGRRAAAAWVDRISRAFGTDEVCVACTVNLRGFPAREYSTTYWTADGARHDWTDADDGTFKAITQSLWRAALDDVSSRFD